MQIYRKCGLYFCRAFTDGALVAESRHYQDPQETMIWANAWFLAQK